MACGDRSSWRLRHGPYLGDVSALCFIPLPRHMCSFPILLAGTGSELLVYDVGSGNLVNAFQVFEGVRVHGICLGSPQADLSSEVVYLVAAFGERRVKLFRLCADVELSAGTGDKLGVMLELVQLLPGFDHWILDVCFLKDDELLAIGLSDNSIALWDLARSTVVARVKSSDRCLLYSMRMWGDSLKGFRVASGTIYNEIIVWKLIPGFPCPSLDMLTEPSSSKIPPLANLQIDDHNYVAFHLNRLIGHEGSIFRMSWSSEGTKLISVSDDRSARIWVICGQKQDFDNVRETHANNFSSDMALFGHNARIWDCYMSDSMIAAITAGVLPIELFKLHERERAIAMQKLDKVLITAGEDCTCRIWGMNGNQLMVFKEHIGRGIWRCLYDPESSLLVTAGFDSAIKVHQLCSSSSKETREQDVIIDDLIDQIEVFEICPPKFKNQLGLMDSKSEYVRCIQFTRENVLYVATNNGYLYRAELITPADVKWTELTQVKLGAQIICMDILVVNSLEFSLDVDDIIAIGDGKGSVTVLGLSMGPHTPVVSFYFTWSAEMERQLLGVHWCRSLGSSYLFTSDPRGTLKLWKIRMDVLEPVYVTTRAPVLLAVFTSSSKHRIMSIDASAKEEVLICGDKRGNITLFPLLEELLVENFKDITVLSPLDHFKGAHGISSVTNIYIGKSNFNYVDIQTTGADGCICYFKYYKTLQKVEFIGMKQVKELSMIQFVFSSSNSENIELGSYAIGFTSVDFIMWDLTNETKTIEIPCGGWRRPYSFYLGMVPEHQYCFAYLKGHIIHVHRLWASAKKKIFPKVLHMQYHGREIHSLCFITLDLLPELHKGCHWWIATGCEDGSVRLARYSYFEIGRWSSSILLGEHVGGSAVRSICFIRKIHNFESYTSRTSSKFTYQSSTNSYEDQYLLISVGSKQVLTTWVLQNSIEEEKNSKNTSDLPKYQSSSVSFQWLSTHMPQKFASCCKGAGKPMAMSDEGSSSTIQSDELSAFSSTNQIDNDWRYLAVTAFLLKHADSRATTCFTVIACSDATLMLRALLLPYRLWFDVASLVQTKSPVLSLQHIVVSDPAQIGNSYILIGGSTDGSIAFWDITKAVESFMQLVLDVQPQMFIDCQRRPKTGRGSQGGRRWRSLANLSYENRLRNGTSDCTDQDSCGNDMECSSKPEIEQISYTQLMSDVPREPSNILSSDLCEIRPLHVLSSVHQSGVNCLHISETKKYQHSKSEIVYCVISGGDDQSLHLFGFSLQLLQARHYSENAQSTTTENHIEDATIIKRAGSSALGSSSATEHTKLRVLFQSRVPSAHSSAVKGVWTDGIWGFSTGLDQRIRCWQIDSKCGLSEHANVVISVPEPEALDAFCDSEGKYQIAVAGRGMQLVEFAFSFAD